MTDGHIRMIESKPVPANNTEMREFLLVLRQALLMIVCFIEKKYGIERKDVLR